MHTAMEMIRLATASGSRNENGKGILLRFGFFGRQARISLLPYLMLLISSILSASFWVEDSHWLEILSAMLLLKCCPDSSWKRFIRGLRSCLPHWLRMPCPSEPSSWQVKFRSFINERDCCQWWRVEGSPSVGRASQPFRSRGR